MSYPPRPLEARFWAKVTVIFLDGTTLPDKRQCWLWTGAKCGGRPGGGSPYGTIHVERIVRDGKVLKRQRKAHVVAYYLHHGVWPELDVCHKCDNPLCCNPHHLFEASHQQNMLDYIRKYGKVAVSKRPLPPRPRLPYEDSERERLEQEEGRGDVVEVHDERDEVPF